MAGIKDILQGLAGWFRGSTAGELYQREQARQNVQQQVLALNNQLNVERTIDQLATSGQGRELALQSHLAQGLNMPFAQRQEAIRQQDVLGMRAAFGEQQRQGAEIASTFQQTAPLALGTLSETGGRLQMLPTGQALGVPNAPSSHERVMQDLEARRGNQQLAQGDVDLRRSTTLADMADKQFEEFMQQAPNRRVNADMETALNFYRARQAELQTERDRILQGPLTDAKLAELSAATLRYADEVDRLAKWAGFRDEVGAYFGTPEDYQRLTDQLTLGQQEAAWQMALRQTPTTNYSYAGWTPERAGIEAMNAQTAAQNANTRVMELVQGSSGAQKEMLVDVRQAIQQYQEALTTASTPEAQQKAYLQLQRRLMDAQDAHPDVSPEEFAAAYATVQQMLGSGPVGAPAAGAPQAGGASPFPDSSGMVQPP